MTQIPQTPTLLRLDATNLDSAIRAPEVVALAREGFRPAAAFPIDDGTTLVMVMFPPPTNETRRDAVLLLCGAGVLVASLALLVALGSLLAVLP